MKSIKASSKPWGQPFCFSGPVDQYQAFNPLYLLSRLNLLFLNPNLSLIFLSQNIYIYNSWMAFCIQVLARNIFSDVLAFIQLLLIYMSDYKFHGKMCIIGELCILVSNNYYNHGALKYVSMSMCIPYVIVTYFSKEIPVNISIRKEFFVSR